MILHAGIDDADSRSGGCTTYVASRVVKFLLERGASFVDYPNLVRLNPNIPWKTKGNAAVALRFIAENKEDIFDGICAIVDENSETGEGKANPGVVMLVSDDVPADLKAFSLDALTDVVGARRALDIAKRHVMFVHKEGSGMGVVGAVAAVGNTLEGDHTYELLAYRSPERWGIRRQVDPASVKRASERTYPHTFNNYDPEKGRILVTPHGPDPVLLGIRGESPAAVLEAFSLLDIREPMESYVIYRTNQGTAAHLTKPLNAKLKAYTSGYVAGAVSRKPLWSRGGHMFFAIRSTSREIECAVYEPTGSLRQVVAQLLPGDLIEVGGGVRPRSSRHPAVVNVEYIRICSTVERVAHRNPACPRCGRTTSSEGISKGYRCDKCGFRSKSLQKVRLTLPRSIREGLYLPPPRAHRHLTKPQQRLGCEKKGIEAIVPSEIWNSFVPKTNVSTEGLHPRMAVKGLW